MDKVQKYNSFNTNTPSSESYRNYLSKKKVVNELMRGVYRKEDETVTSPEVETY